MEITIGQEDMATVLSDNVWQIANLELQIAALKRKITELDKSSEEDEEDADSGEG